MTSMGRMANINRCSGQEYFYRTLVNVSSRHKHLTAIAGYIVRLIKAVTHLGLEKTINMEEWRRQDRDDAIESFKFCVNGLLDDYLDLGAQADDLIHDLMLHIDNNKTYVEELLSLAGYHPLKHSEKAAIDVRLAQLKEQVHRRHQYILARPPVPLDVQYQEDKKLRKAAREAVLQPHVLGVDQLTVTTESLGNAFSLHLSQCSSHSAATSIGRGQLGEVYRGFYNNRMDVAIKVIPIKKSQTDAQFYKQIIALENEVVLLRHAEHPSILYCYGLARDPHHVYIVTELAEMGM